MHSPFAESDLEDAVVEWFRDLGYGVVHEPLVEEESLEDQDHGGRYTVKVYRSERAASDDGGWRHVEIRLESDTHAPGYEPMVLHDMPEEAIRVIAELVEVLP